MSPPTCPGATKSLIPIRETGKKGEGELAQFLQGCSVGGPLFPAHRLAEKGSERRVT